MVRFVAPVLASLLCLATIDAASAQDMAAPGPYDHTSKPGPYVRLDAGGSFTSAAHRSFGNADQGESYVLGAGVGWRFLPQLRVDLTLGYRGDYGFDTTGGIFRLKGDLESFTGLVSAYYDIVTIRGFTPYMGFGVGFADNSYSRSRLTAGSTTLVTINGHSNTEFAWQAAAGVSYSFTQNWAIDVGYHYVDMGTAQTGSVVGAAPGSGPALTGDLQAHEVTVGLRYSF
jgi:opacity protein-like surface antigen